VDEGGARAGRRARTREGRRERASADDADFGNGFARLLGGSREVFVAGSRTTTTTTTGRGFRWCVDVVDDVSVERTVEGEDGGETSGDGCRRADSGRAGVGRRRKRGRATNDDADDDDDDG
jgi:hypothetical protein